MTTPISEANHSRRKARAFIKKTYFPDLPRNSVVHHIDLNPLNNTPSNLVVLPQSTHMKLHRKPKKAKKPETTGLDKLESLVNLYNEGQWIDTHGLTINLAKKQRPSSKATLTFNEDHT
jgi:hypothetical protein